MAEAAVGLVTLKSAHSVDETVAKIIAMLAAKGITLFALVDHSGEAAKAGLALRPTKLLIFGNPKGGTPLMAAAPSAAIDLPLKLLVWQDEQQQVEDAITNLTKVGSTLGSIQSNLTAQSTFTTTLSNSVTSGVLSRMPRCLRPPVQAKIDAIGLVDVGLPCWCWR